MTEDQTRGVNRRGSLLADKDAERYFTLNRTLLEFSRLFDDSEPNERAMAIVGAAFLDTILEHMLTAYLVDDEKEVKRLLNHQQPLGTLGARTTMCYCLGLIPKIIRDDLRTVGNIRNRFAHDLNASFADERIRAWCMNLEWHRTAYVTPPEGATARDHFQVGVNCLVTYLNGIVGQARLSGCDELVFLGT
jgi:hypothetical protein